MKQKYLLHIYLLLILALGFKTSNATITVDSVHVTISTCPNNGTAKVYARSTNSNAVFLFNVVSGPVTYTQQNDSTFYSLYPGSYTGWVHDVNSFDSTRFAFTISGSYATPVVAAKITSPVCITGNEGEITGQVVSGTGLSPFTWQIISPDSSASQASAVFSNLAPGSYIIRVNDGCGISRTASNYIDPADLGFTFTFLQMNFLTCNTARRAFSITIDSDKATIPLKVSTTTSNGTNFKYLVPDQQGQSSNPGSYSLIDTVNDIHYGDYFNICISDTCGNVICYTFDSITHFRFSIDYTIENLNCAYDYVGNIGIQPGPEDIVILDGSPITTILTDTINHVVVDSFTKPFASYFQCTNCALIAPQSDSITYLLTVKDGCGNVYAKNINWPAPPILLPYVNAFPAGPGCIDSTEVIQFHMRGFKSGAHLEILSGPSVAESSAPGFSYRDTIIYPLNYSLNLGDFFLSNTPSGKYVFNISDSCGNSVTDSIVLTDVESLEVHPIVTYGCDGLSSVELVKPLYGANYNPTLVDLITRNSAVQINTPTTIVWGSL